MRIEEALAAYSRIGFKKIEAYTCLLRSAVDFGRDPAEYVQLAGQYGMRFSSLHLPAVDNSYGAIEGAIDAARFAQGLGSGVVVFRASSRPRYVEAARELLNGIEGMALVPAIQNQAGSPISGLDDMRVVLEAMADPRFKVVLDVGHFHSVGVHWQEACNAFAGQIALVRIRDQVGLQPVPFGTGEIDLPRLFAHLRRTDYTGDIVVEMEVEDMENTLQYLAAAAGYLRAYCL